MLNGIGIESEPSCRIAAELLGVTLLHWWVWSLYKTKVVKVVYFPNILCSCQCLLLLPVFVLLWKCWRKIMSVSFQNL